MKKVIFIIAALLLVSVLLLVIDSKEPELLPENTSINDVFIIGDTIYTLHDDNAGKDSRAGITVRGETELFYELPGGSDTVWSDSDERLFYGKGCTIYCCDLSGNYETAIWKLPNGTRADYARVYSIYDDMLVIRVGHGYLQRYYLFEYYSFDLVTGEAVLLLGDLGVTQVPMFIGGYENEVFYLKPTGDFYKSLIAKNLKTAETRQLGTFDGNMSVSSGELFCLDGTLYFTYNGSVIYHVPITGGDVEYSWPDNVSVLDLKYMQLYNGEIYLLMRTGGDDNLSWTYRLYVWGRETNLLSVAGIEDEVFSRARGFTIENGKYYVYSSKELYEGTLK